MTEEVKEKKPLLPTVVLDSEDVIALLGLIFLIAGIFWIYKPAALIVLGALLLSYAYVSANKPKENSGNRKSVS
jgi:hypothetical protein